MKLDQQSFEGKVVFVGIDVHKRTYTIVAVAEGMKAMKFANLPADPEALATFLRRRLKGAVLKTAYEAGFSGFVLHRVLSREGIDNIVVNPSSIEIAANNRVKTDRRDALKVAEQLKTGQLQGIRIPSVEEEQARLITRTRTQVVNLRKAVGNMIKSKLVQFGLLEHDDERVMGPRLLKEIEASTMAPELALAVKALAAIYRCAAEQICELEEKMAAQAKAQEDLERIYCSAPGLGPISGRVLCNELGDMSQFSNERQLCAFVGLTPSEHSSGTDRNGDERKRRGRITKQGRALIRGVLVEAAWRAIAQDPALRQIYDRLKIRCGGKRAIVAVARHLLVRIRASLKRKEVYRMAA